MRIPTTVTRSRSRVLFAALASLAFVAFGCGDDAPLSPSEGTRNGSGVLGGNVELDDAVFEFITRTPTGSDDGPFAIRGENIRYESGNLIVDLSVVNLGDESYSEPVSLTFLSLLPEGVTVANPDNGETGPGAMITFEFDDGDGTWSPGEESLGRPTNFVVDEGMGVGFVARVDAGATDGSIGGMVWDDVNGDGIMDTEETGLEGAMVALDAEGMETATAVTGADGTYTFEGLASGFYTVSKVESDSAILTTDSPIYVILVESGGEVSSFLSANFGCQVVDGGLPEINGTVYDDANENGTRDEGEDGLPDIEVNLTGPNGLNGTGTTDESGQYVFFAPEAGEYTVSVTVPEGWTATTDESVTVTLGEGEGTTIDFGLSMGDGGLPEITGIVFDDANENGTRDEGEDGLPDIELSLTGPNGLNGVGTTDENGQYVFFAPEAGEYTVSVTVPESWTATTDATVTVQLGEGEGTTIDFGLAMTGGGGA
jgi:hypothetical protein